MAGPDAARIGAASRAPRDPDGVAAVRRAAAAPAGSVPVHEGHE
ncbi:hypothetical protein [Streptomyces sp. NPDC087437]